MANASSASALPRPARVLGTVFLLFQLLLAANSYGPQRIAGLNLLFSEPWLNAEVPQSPVGSIQVRLEDVSKKAGLSRFERPLFHDANPLYLEVMAGGIAVGDFDGDGREDLFFTGLGDFAVDQRVPASALFRNLGDGTFTDVAAPAGLADLKGHPQGALSFDYDNDGDQDLYVAAYEGGQLFRNDGGRFTDHTGAAGLDLTGRCGALPCMGTAAASADYDRDGHLDLVVVNNVHWNMNDPAHHGQRNLFPAFFHAQPSFLFRNNGDGTFRNVSEETGVSNAEGKALGAVWLDVNDDGWQDLYFANDLSHNALYINRQDGTFEEVAAAAGVDEIKSSMGVSAADYDGDGRMDLAVTNLKGSGISLFRNQGDLRFDYATGYAGLASSARASGWGVEFVDLDLDGRLDLVSGGGPVWEKNPVDTRHLVYRNIGNGKFEDVTEQSGDIYGRFVSRGMAITDFNDDGRPDIIFNHVDGGSPLLLKNDPLSGNHFLTLRLQGTASNRDAVGARVELVRADGQRLVQEVRAGSSYQSTSSRALFFGLGESTARELTVRWPSGAVETITQVPVDASTVLVEGSGVLPSVNH